MGEIQKEQKEKEDAAKMKRSKGEKGKGEDKGKGERKGKSEGNGKGDDVGKGGKSQPSRLGPRPSSAHHEGRGRSRMRSVKRNTSADRAQKVNGRNLSAFIQPFGVPISFISSQYTPQAMSWGLHSRLISMAAIFR